MEQFIVSARKYRPEGFEAMVGQDNITTTLKNSIIRGQLAHAYLFCGPRGVGKTSAARIFAKSINCLNPGDNMEPCGKCESCLSFKEGRSYCIHELDAASNNSVDDIRNLTDMVRIPPQIGKYSVYIIDEVHMLSSAAFNAFLKTLEEPPAHAIFILATTEKHKILPTILSRCQTYDFNRISVEDIVLNLKNIANKENITIEEDALHIIAQKADGAMRDALTLFDQTIAFSGKNITYQEVVKNLNVLDYEYYFRLIESILKGDHTSTLLIFDDILSKGFNALHFISGLSSHLRDLLICKNEASRTLLSVPPSIVKKYEEQANNTSIKFIFDALTATTGCEAAYRQSGNQRLLIEFTLLKLSSIQNQLDNTAIPIQKEILEAPKAQEAPKAPENSTPPAASIPKEVEESPKISRVSLKSMLKKAEDNINGTKIEEVKNSQFSQEQLEEAWQKLANSEKENNRVGIATALMLFKPEIREDGTIIVFYVSNISQKTWIENKCLYRMNGFIQEQLNNNTIKMIVELHPSSEENEKQQKLHMPMEKAKHIYSKNEELRELGNELQLDID